MVPPQRRNSRARGPARIGHKRGPTAILAVLGTAGLLFAVAVVATSGLLSGSDEGSPPAQGMSFAPAVVAGVEAPEPWADLGRVPLDTPVRHVYTLRNTGPAAATLGKASIEVLEGC